MASRQLRFYFPARTLILIFGEVGILVASFLLATVLQFREQTYAVLSYEYGLYKIAAVVAMGLLCMYYLDFYDTQRIPGRGELQFRVLVVVGTLSLLLGLLGAIFPRFMVGNYVFLTGLPILTFLLIAWRNVFFAMNGSERFMQRTLFLGDGDYSNSIWDEVKSRSALGLKLVGYVSPEVFGLHMVIVTFTMLYVGGIGTVAGPLVGALIVSLLPETFRAFKDYQDLAYGAALILLLIYAPRGLASLFAPRGRS